MRGDAAAASDGPVGASALTGARLPLSTADFLELTAELASAVERWHCGTGVHGALCPELFTVDRSEDGRITRARLRRPQGPPSAHARYAAPEQSGRLFRDIDERADLYALGVILYELATGASPIPAENPAQRTRRQLTGALAPPVEIAPDLPGVLNDIVSQLLEVQPEERYRTARGLAADLRRCREELAERGELRGFIRGRWDVPDRLRTTGRLFGRRDRLARLAAAYRRAVAGPGLAIACITGDDGLGKTALLGQFTDGQERGGARVARVRAGLPPDRPFPTLARLLADLGEHLMTESEGDPGPWRHLLTPQLGPVADALLAVVPSLADLLGRDGADGTGRATPAAVDRLAGTPARRRLQLAVRRMLSALAEAGTPLVIAVDDAHRADQASLDLLADVLDDLRPTRLMAVFTYPSREVDDRHPLTALLRRHADAVTSVPLRPLADAFLADLLADALEVQARAALQLARFVAGEGTTNPLQVLQFLRRLADLRQLWFDAETASWLWAPEALQAGRIDVSTLPAAISEERYPPQTRRLMGAAAMLESAFPVGLLADVAGVSPAELTERFGELTADGILVPAYGGGGFRWAHETYRRAARDGLSPAEKKALRAQVNAVILADEPRAGWRLTPEEALAHLAAAGPPTTNELKAKIAQLRLTAGRRALLVGAARAARDELMNAVGALPLASWRRKADLAFAVHLATAEAVRHVHGREAAESMTERALTYADRDQDRVAALALRARWRCADGDPNGAYEAAAAALAILGMPVPTNPAALPDALHDALDETRAILLGRTREQLLSELTPTAGTTESPALRLISGALALPAMGHDGMALLAAIGVRLALDGATPPTAATVFACFAAALADRAVLAERAESGMGATPPSEDARTEGSIDESSARAAAELALSLVDAYPAPGTASRVLPVRGYVRPLWTGVPLVVLDTLRRAIDAALEDGELAEALRCRTLLAAHRLLVAHRPVERLDALAEELAGAAADIAQEAYPVTTVLWRGLTTAVDRLSGTQTELAQPSPTETARSAAVRSGEVGFASTVHLAVDLAAAVFLGESGRAVELGRTLRRTAGGLGSLVAAIATFHHALGLAAHADTVTGEERPHVLAELDELLVDLTHQAAREPAHFGPMALLATAERNRLTDPAGTTVGYQQAIDAAREHGAEPVEALAAELAGRQAMRRGEPEQAAAYLRRARSRYESWGAYAKVREIDELLEHAAASAGPSTVLDPLDVLAIVSAFRAISAELGLDRLVATVLELLVEHGRADRAALLLPGPGGLRVAAVGTTEHGHVKVLADPDGPEADHVPLNLVARAALTGRPVRGQVEHLPEGLADDPYLKATRPGEVLCVPLRRDGELVGVIYLERGHQAGAFEHRRSELLDILCTQAAVALHNATAHARLLEANRVLDATFDQLPLGLILLGPDLTVRRVSAAAESLTGLPIQPGTPLVELIDVLTPYDAAGKPFRFEPGLAPISRESAPIHRTVTIVLPTGERRELATTSIPLRDGEGVLVGVTILVEPMDG